jgi:glycosyltransferase involved in cell wall biosynthesis
MPLRILIDLQGAQNGSRHRGIGRYSLALARAIARNAGEHRIFVLLNGLFVDTIEEIRASFSGVLAPDRFLIFTSPGPVAELKPQNTWRRRTAEILREYVIDTLSPDVVLITSMIEGSEDDTITSVGSIRSSVPVTAILYDLIPLSDPDRYIGWEPLRVWYHAKIDSLRRCDFLFAISQSATNEAIDILGIQPTQITNISSAADTCFSSQRVSYADAVLVAKRFGIGRKYLMHSGAFELRKNFQGLIRAYAALPRSVRADYQLVLVSKLDAHGREELTALATSVGLAPDDMVLTGFVPDDDLIALYTACHLFVFPSFHEGFGLPALEAMCCGTPTIGSNATSVPEVIGRADFLFDPNSVKDTTALISKALTNANFYQSLRTHAKTQAAMFSWDKTALRALAGLEKLVVHRAPLAVSFESAATKHRNLFEAVAEVARNLTPSALEILDLARSIEANENAVNRIRASAAFGGALTWRLEGPFDSTYSLALINRETARALSALGHTVVLHSTEGPGDFAANPHFLQLNPDLNTMHRRVADYPHENVDAVSRNLYPPRVHDMKGRLSLMHNYAWEESGFPAAWAANFNNYLDGVICVSTHVQKTLVDNGVHVRMTTSGNGVDHWDRITATPHYSVEGRAFRFLHVSSCFPRKGIEVLLDAFGNAFTNADDVTLIVKTFANPHNEIRALLAERKSRASNYPDVVVIDSEMTDSDLKALYQQCHALVAPSRAEGFGLPLAEAMLSGLAVITTGWSGQLDFCTEQTAWLVDYSFQRAQTHFELFDSVWAEPGVASLADALSTVVSTPLAQRRAKAKLGRELLLENFKWADVAARLVVFAKSSERPQRSPVSRIGWITTWNTKCGIAAYSEHLIAQFPQEVTVLAPHQHGKIREDEQGCIRSWRSSKHENGFEELGAAVAQLELNTLVLQFNYGFYNFRQLNRFLGAQIDAGRAVIVIMHSTGDPGLLPEWNWTLAEIVPALARCQRVLVHTTDDLNRLKQLGLVSNVSIFPHGVLDVEYVAPARAAGSLPIVCTYGFCLPHKGLVELVRAAALLSEHGTPVRLRLVNAEYPMAISSELAAQIRKLVSELGLEELIETHHDYLPDQDCLRLLRDADLILFPYQETNESASGAVRFGLATRRPVAVTPIAIFADLGNAVHRLPGTKPQDLAKGIADVLSNLGQETELAKSIETDADKWRSSHTYAALSARLHGICKAIASELQPNARVFDGSSRQLSSQVGRISGRSLLSTGVAGYLVFGPYLNLPAGRYCLVVIGKLSLPIASKAHLDVCAAGGAEVFTRFDFAGSAESRIADVEFSLEIPCRDLEIRVSVDKYAHIRIDQIEVRLRVASGVVESDVASESTARMQVLPEQRAPGGHKTV